MPKKTLQLETSTYRQFLRRLISSGATSEHPYKNRRRTSQKLLNAIVLRWIGQTPDKLQLPKAAAVFGCCQGCALPSPSLSTFPHRDILALGVGVCREKRRRVQHQNWTNLPRNKKLLVTRPKKPRYRKTPVARPLSHCVDLVSETTAATTPLMLSVKMAYRSPKTGLGGRVSQKKLTPLKPIAK